MDVDLEGRLENVIWIHQQVKDAYGPYDIVNFDTTYLVDMY